MKFKVAITLLTVLFTSSGCTILGKITGIPSASAGAYAELLSTKDELAKFEASGTPTGRELPTIKGKVAIVKTEGPGQASLDRFDWEGKFSDAPVDKRWRFYPAEVYAKSPAEIGTLIKIECREHIGSDYYKASPNSESQRQSFAKTICGVSVIDYKEKVLLATVQKGNESSPGVITIGEGGSGHYEVLEEIGDYLKSLPLELLPRVKATPSGEILPVAELVKSYTRSKESLSQYQDKELTITGWGAMASSAMIFIYGNEKENGVHVTCQIEASDMADFAEVGRYERYKFTVVGSFTTKNLLMSLERCRLVKAEKMPAR